MAVDRRSPPLPPPPPICACFDDAPKEKSSPWVWATWVAVLAALVAAALWWPSS